MTTRQAIQTYGAVAATSPAFFLNGNNGYALSTQRVTLHADQISSPSHFSGELTLQLWALEAQFDGQQLYGKQIATLDLGVLLSGNDYVNISQEVDARLPSSGTYHIVLALVEKQNGCEYIHDWRGYARSETFTEAPLVDSLVTPAAEVVDVTPEEIAQAVAALEKPAAKEPKKVPTAKTVKVPAAKTKKTPTPKVVKVSQTKAKSTRNDRLNINTASEDSIAAIKGVSRNVAKALVSARPFKKYDELLAVKGIGPKMLEKLKVQIKL